MDDSPFNSIEEELKEAAEMAYWEQNKALNAEEEETYEEWLQAESAYWGYNKR